MSQISRPSSILRRRAFGCLLALLCVCKAHAQQPDQRQRTSRFLHGRANPAQALQAARREHLAMAAQPRAASLTAAWTSVGPAQVATASYGSVTGRVTSVAIDPADATGNTVYLGTTGGGVWKSTNAAGPAASIVFTPLTDVLPVFSANAGASAIPSLSIGALGIANGVLLAGTGDPNDATDSYYGGGLLRSVDGGVTWTLIQGSHDGVAGNHSFVGLSFAGFAFSSATPSLVVAALSQAAEGDIVNAADLTNSVKGLYYSSDAGVTWQMATVEDGSQIVQTPQLAGQNQGGNAATAVVWNPLRQRFYAAIRYHGFYESVDGATWTRLAHQPGAGLTLAACPTNAGGLGSSSCPLFRAALAVQPVTGDTFALSVDNTNKDQGLWQDVCAATGAACATSPIQFATQLPSAALEQGSGSTVIAQADYDLTLAAIPSASDTLLFTGTIDLFRCSIAAGCVQRNTTNALNGCAAPAKVAPAQHAVAGLASGLVYLANDGGLWRSTDGVGQLQAPCSADDANHFQNLNGGLGSLAEVVSFAQNPVDPTLLLAGLGANGTAASTATVWPQLAVGEGGAVAIDPANPSLWYLSTAAGVSIGRCAKGSACAASDFTGLPAIGATQTANDLSEIDAPWLLDPALTSSVLIGTCRAWRGAATGAGWSSLDLLGAPFGAPAATACASSSPVVRSLAAGGPVSSATAIQNAGSQVLYAGLAGTDDGGNTSFGGHLFATFAGGTATSSTVWTDLAKSTVTNDAADAGVFNPGGFDISSVTVDAHDPSGQTVYATVMGFAGNGVSAPHLYRSTDGGAHWLNISSNLPNAPANAVVVDPNDANTLYVALDTGLYVTSAVTSCASANCWSIYGTGLPNAPVVGLAAAVAMPTGDGRTGELRAATYGRGIWQIPLVTAISPAAPAMTLSPTALTFATEPVGTASAAQTVTVTNSGNAALTVSSVTTTGDFNQTNTCLAAPIGAGASCTVQVVFLPSATGARSGVLTVYGNVAGGQATASLNGIGKTPAAVVLTPVALSFPSAIVGARSAVQNIAISNTGGVASAIASIAISGDFVITANTCGATLAAGTGCTVSIVFAPSASGVRTGTLTVVDDVGTQTASLTGTGTAPATDALAPLSLSFAPQVLNTASAAQQVTLTNSGDVALTLIAASIASGDFTAVNGCGASLNAHSTCVIAVSFVPKSVGAQTGVLTVADQFRSQSVALSGAGLAPAGVSLSPVSGLTFANTPVGQTSAVQTVTLTNNGGVALAISGVAVTGDFVSSASTCGSSLAAGAACALQVAFSPTVAGPRTGTLTFTDSAASSPQSLALAGIGIDFSLTPNGPTTATLVSGATASYGLLLSSAAGVPGTVAFTCTGAPAHAACAVSPAAPSLGGTTTITVNVGTGLAKASPAPLPWGRRAVWLALLLPLALLPRRRRRFAALCLLLALAGCGDARKIPATSLPSGSTPTPSGTYNLVVSGSGGGVTKMVGLTLVVQ
ncbi:Transmembrane protein 131-like [Granulicella rosea]|uniref:Transmembrane protein 131-like n=1 Tax=Granulicella rosea TaxID=474952 RepID=A0A239DH90_9BACT|nr:choice-of-anchor D domain-containing protein [Granulicella rosea]SNS31770.1 Transmembrane protein 131-like [Granulicella rosea]